MVPPPGNAPGSSVYRTGALLLSYRGFESGGDRGDRTLTTAGVITVFKTDKHANLADLRKLNCLADPGGFEPPTRRLTGGCSTVELRVNN